MLDLGVSSYQLDEKNRGFSYLGENELDMRMDKTQELNANIVINTYPEERLANLIYEYGEERFSRQIAKNICEQRKQKEINSKIITNPLSVIISILLFVPIFVIIIFFIFFIVSVNVSSSLIS